MTKNVPKGVLGHVGWCRHVLEHSGGFLAHFRAACDYNHGIYSEPREARRTTKRAGERSEVANESPGGGYAI